MAASKVFVGSCSDPRVIDFPCGEAMSLDQFERSEDRLRNLGALPAPLCSVQQPKFSRPQYYIACF